MNFLVDTHGWLWMRTDLARLGKKARAVLEDPKNTLWFSAVSAWEIAAKHALGKLPLPTTPEAFVRDTLRVAGARALAVDVEHTLRAAALPRLHRDPFDRLLVAQAQVEELVVVTNDDLVAAYDVNVLWR